jgi:SAM-dependent methyltransferase
MSKLSSGFWDNQASAKKKFDVELVDKTKFVSDYFNNICFGLFKKYLKKSDAPLVLKTDLWNESVSPEREMLAYFKEAGQFGSDISNVVCKAAYARNKKVFVSQGDVRNLPYKDGSFDVILDISTIDHVSETDAIKVIEEYSRILSKDGILFLLYAQKYPFARHYWNNAFTGVYLLDSKLISDNVTKQLVMIDDRGLDFVHGLFGVGPKRLFERFLVWHCPAFVREAVVAVIYRLECSRLSSLTRGYCGLRLNIAIKKA